MKQGIPIGPASGTEANQALQQLPRTVVPSLLVREDAKIAQGKLQAAVVGMVVVADGEGDVDGVSNEERGLLQALGHVPGQSVEDDGASPSGAGILPLRIGITVVLRRSQIAFWDRGAIGMAAG